MPRLTLKLSGQGPLLVSHVDVDGPVSPDAFARAVAAAKDALVTPRAGRKHTATRHGAPEGDITRESGED